MKLRFLAASALSGSLMLLGSGAILAEPAGNGTVNNQVGTPGSTLDQNRNTTTNPSATDTYCQPDATGKIPAGAKDRYGNDCSTGAAGTRSGTNNNDMNNMNAPDNSGANKSGTGVNGATGSSDVGNGGTMNNNPANGTGTPGTGTEHNDNTAP